jgi:CheY-like chemotaxis protein
MDFDLPLMDGFSVTKKIRDFEKNKIDEENYERVPIVCLTSHREKGFYEECLKNGMDDYMTKPVLKEKLIDILNKWVNKT